MGHAIVHHAFYPFLLKSIIVRRGGKESYVKWNHFTVPTYDYIIYTAGASAEFLVFGNAQTKRSLKDMANMAHLEKLVALETFHQRANHSAPPDTKLLTTAPLAMWNMVNMATEVSLTILEINRATLDHWQELLPRPGRSYRMISGKPLRSLLGEVIPFIV